MEKHRSNEDQYAKLIIKKYTYWTLYVHKDQRYLGRAYAWLLRDVKIQDFFDIYPQEEFELFRIAQRYKRALTQLWKPDHMNYAWLGNEIEAHGGHGHMHMIPRYKYPLIFAGDIFHDARWGKNYSPYNPHRPAEELLFKIRDAIREKIS